MDLAYAEESLEFASDDPAYLAAIGKFIRDQTRRLRQVAGGFSVPARPLVLRGAPVPALLALARSSGYELLAIGTHGRRGLSRLLLGSVAEEVIRNSPIPVMTLGLKAQAATPSSRELRQPSHPRILVATDLGPNSRRAERFAARLAREAGAELVLVHALFGSLHPVIQNAFSSATPAPQLQELFDDSLQAAERKMKARCSRLRKLGIAARSEIDASEVEAHSGLLKAIRRFHPQYVVLGTHGRTAVVRAFLGSTAREVVQQSPVPVITVRSRS